MTHPDTLTIPRAVVEQAIGRAEFEQWYACNAFNFERDPIGSRDCGLQWVAWQASRAALQPQATQAASDCRTCQHLSEAWGVCEARPKCVGGEQYVYFPEKQLWDKTPRNDGQAAHQEMREALYAEFNSAVGRQHD